MRPARATSNDSSDQSDEIKSVSFAGALWESRSFLFFFSMDFEKMVNRMKERKPF